MATLEQIQEKLKKLKAQADAMLAKKAQDAVDKIRALMREHGLTTADIEAEAKVTRQGRTPKRTASSVKAKGAPRYQHPKTGATWSGRGRAPAWIADAKDRTKFLIASRADTAVTASETTARKTKVTARKPTVTTSAVARKRQPKGPQPAIYRDPKSGATWSGRGRAPGWIGADRSKFLIDGVLAESNKTTSSAAARTKAAQVAKAETQKGIAKKIATKKMAAKKVTTAKKASAVKAPVRKAAAKKIAAKTDAKNVEDASVNREASAREATA